jgi:hypothetical protein
MFHRTSFTPQKAMIKNYLSLLLCLLSFTIQAQSFEEWIRSGDEHYSNKNYEASGEAYDAAFKLEEGTATQYYNAACSWALAGDPRVATHYLHRAADKGWWNVSHIKRDKDLESMHNRKAWGEIINRIKKNKELYEKDFNQELKAQLETIYVRDQTLRQLYSEAIDKFGRESVEMDYYWEVVNAEDRKNEAEVEAIIQAHGWVGRSLVGGKANAALWLVIQHAPLELQEKYLPLLKASVLQGESQANHLALMEDRVQMGKGLPQTYGSQFTWDEELGKEVLYKVKDPEYVNQRRREVALPPIESYLAKKGMEWTVPQKEKE